MSETTPLSEQEPVNPSTSTEFELADDVITDFPEQVGEEPAPARQPLISNYAYQRPWSSAMSDDQFDYSGDTETLAIPPAPNELTKTLLNGTPPPSPDSAEEATWASTLEASANARVYANALNETVSNPASAWAQGYPTPQGYITGGPPKLAFDPKRTLSPDQAVMAARSQAKLGTIISVPLWASGFWIRLRSPSENTLLEFNQLVSDDKVELGRYTFGLIGGNTTSYIKSALLDLVMAHVQETSLALKAYTDLRSLISAHDLDGLFLRLAESIWPSGVQFTRSCVANPDKCKHVMRGRLMLGETHITDFSKFTEAQRRHMSNRAKGAMSLESLKAYQNEFAHIRSERIRLTEGITVTLAVPSALNYITSGFAWIDGIERSYGEVLAQKVEERNAYLQTHARASMMRLYGHYVESMTIGEHVIQDRDAIEKVLSNLSEDKDIRAVFLKEVQRYIEDTTVTVSAIDAANCPSCGGRITSPLELPAFPGLIPLDVVSIFFTLLGQKVREIRKR